MTRTPQAVVTELIRSFERGDREAMRSLMDEGFRGHVTTADGGVRSADRDEYLASVDRMDVPSANLRLGIPNIVTVGPERVLVMVEVHAERGGRSLHNFSGQLATVSNGSITELWMVDALPTESDEFWAQH